MIPDALREGIEKELSLYSFQKVKAARENLSEKYRRGLYSPLSSNEERAAYIATRMPATYAVMERVFAEIDFQGKTVLDLGAGPGTAFWALPGCGSITHIEQDREMISLAKRLAPESPHTWIKGDIKDLLFPASEIALFSYSFNEVLDIKLIEKAWQSCNTLILIEPGTPKGYSHVLQARERVLQLGGYLIAPCPHALKCPLKPPDWCHFAVRLPRLKWHKDLKEGTLGYEDEKYSYLIASKTPSAPYYGRILSPPEHHSGYLKLRLCTQEGVVTPTLSKRDKERYKSAKKLSYGDKFEN